METNKTNKIKTTQKKIDLGLKLRANDFKPQEKIAIQGQLLSNKLVENKWTYARFLAQTEDGEQIWVSFQNEPKSANYIAPSEKVITLKGNLVSFEVLNAETKEPMIDKNTGEPMINHKFFKAELVK